MKVFICGSLYPEDFSDPQERRAIADASRDLGRELGRRGAELIVGIDIEESVDRYVVEGALEEARKTKNKLQVYVFFLKSLQPNIPYSELSHERSAEVHFHEVDSNVWHVAHMEAVENCDCVLLLAGKAGTLVSGLTSMHLGTPFLPIAAFGGGAKDVWRIAMHDPTRYFFDALNQDELDKLVSPWHSEKSPPLISDYLSKLTFQTHRRPRVDFYSLLPAILGMLAGIGLYIYLLSLGNGETGAVTWGLLLVLIGSMAGGAVGASLSILTALNRPPVTSWDQVATRVLTGVGAGFLAFLLLPSAQLLTEGTVSLNLAPAVYLRFILLAGGLATYSGLCTSVIVKKFIARMSGKVSE